MLVKPVMGYKTPYDLSCLPLYSRVVAGGLNITIPDDTPVVGKNASGTMPESMPLPS